MNEWQKWESAQAVLNVREWVVMPIGRAHADA